jgi:NAD(P)-dependent dehydrogenase (short-subunit alcohol dehydrogenase family)
MTTGAVSVISGGSSGIGLAVAERLAGGGGRIAVLGRDREKLVVAKETLEEAGADAVLALSADVSKDDEVAAAFREIDATWGEVHALINAVGPSGAGRFEDLTDEAWVHAFDQGALTSVRCVRHGLPLLRRAEWGRIVNITAVSVQHHSIGLIAYTASKAALASITKNLARSLAADGILVNAVAPGPVLTGPIQAAVRAAHGDPDDRHDAYAPWRSAMAPRWTSDGSRIRPKWQRWSPSAPRRRTPT